MQTPITAEMVKSAVTHYRIDVCGQYGRGYHRAITFVDGTDFEVADHREVVYSGPSAEDAVDAYHAIQPRDDN